MCDWLCLIRCIIHAETFGALALPVGEFVAQQHKSSGEEGAIDGQLPQVSSARQHN